MPSSLHTLPLLLALASAPAWATSDFETFHARFRAAVAGGDAGAVAALTRMPFLFENRLHDAQGFVRQVWPRLFDARLRRCVARETPRPEGEDRVLFCGHYALYFDTAGGRWALREFGADAEADG